MFLVSLSYLSSHLWFCIVFFCCKLCNFSHLFTSRLIGAVLPPCNVPWYFFAFCSVLLFSARVELDTSSLASGVKAELMPPPCTVCAPQPLQTPIVWSKCIVLSAQVTSCIARNEFVCSLCVLVSSWHMFTPCSWFLCHSKAPLLSKIISHQCICSSIWNWQLNSLLPGRAAASSCLSHEYHPATRCPHTPRKCFEPRIHYIHYMKTKLTRQDSLIVAHLTHVKPACTHDVGYHQSLSLRTNLKHVLITPFQVWKG